MKNLALLTQLGLSFITPILACLAFCWWLTTRGLGGWIYIPGFFFGLGGSFMVAYKFYLAETGHTPEGQRPDGAQKQEEKPKVSYNQH